MTPHPTHLTPETHAALLAESQRRREALRQRRDLRERLPSVEAEFANLGWSDSAAAELAFIHLSSEHKHA